MRIGLWNERPWILALGIAALACGREAETPAASEPVVVEEAVEVPPPPTSSPLVAREPGIDLPDGFPDDVATDKAAEMLGVTEEDGKIFVQLKTTAEYPGVMDFYERSLNAHGWTTKRSYDPTDENLGGAIFGEKEGRQTSVFVTNGDGGVLVDIFVEPAP